MRHGIAHELAGGLSDSDRALTAEGRERIILEVAGLRALGITPDVVVASPVLRCAQTGELVAEGLRVPLETDRRLAPGMTIDHIADMLLEHPNAQMVLVCGHQPDLSYLLAELAGAVVEFKKGSLAILDLEPPNWAGAFLTALYPPAALRALGSGA